MKYKFLSLCIAGLLLFTACNDESTQPQDQHTSVNKDSTPSVEAVDTAGLQVETTAYTGVDPKAATAVDELVGHYLHVKNALAADNSSDAAEGAKGMVSTLDKMDASVLAPDQKKLYDEIQESLKEHAEHTVHNAKDIHHQREHFVSMSEDMYDLVRAFGSNKPLYVAHCPMANNNKGADWLSDRREIQNPYMGKEMPKCGTVEKVVKK